MYIDEMFPIYIDLAVNNLYFIAGQTNDTFDEVFALVYWINKYNHIIALRLADGYYGLVYKRDFNAIYEFINKDMVSNHKSRFH